MSLKSAHTGKVGKAFINARNRRSISPEEAARLALINIEYILIDGVNDSLDHAKDLVNILNGLSCKINLIPFNPFDGCNYLRSQESTIYQFKDFLIKKGLITTLRITRGDAIDGACGQLVGKLTKSVKGKNKKNSINLINTS